MRKRSINFILCCIVLLCLAIAAFGIWRLTCQLSADYKLPPADGRYFEYVQNNEPQFERAKFTTGYEYYGERDYLGRCTLTEALISRESMPSEDRESIGMIKPTGWHTVKYPCIEDKYLYNRCHLIAYQLTGENANENNLITGTRQMNVQGMLPFEELVGNYVRDTGNTVMYRVEPVFTGSNLLADGVHIQAQSVEDNRISFNVFCYNTQDGIAIDYSDGSSKMIS